MLFSKNHCIILALTLIANVQSHIIAPFFNLADSSILDGAIQKVGRGFWITIAFFEEGWNPDPTQIQSIRNNGGDIIISSGGSKNSVNRNEVAMKYGDLAKVISLYSDAIKNTGATFIDFDIEEGAEKDVNSYQRRNKAIAILQQNNPNLKVSFSVPDVQDGILSALPMLQDAIAQGVRIDTINLMTMIFGNEPDIPSRIIKDLNSARDILQKGGINANLGVVPMIGNNGDGTFYSIDMHQKVLANMPNFVTHFTFWNLQSDRDFGFAFLKSYLDKYGPSK